MSYSDVSNRKEILRLSPWMKEFRDPFQELMAYYRCAMMEVETKFKVLNEEYSFHHDRNPIETIKTRLKTPESITEKMERRGYDLTIDSIERNLDDVAGVRVICSFPSDIYILSDALLRQDDLIPVDTKDYIKNPKANGYRSLHQILAVPIFLHDHKKIMTVEVQFRTMAMDWWASLEHKITYKKELSDDAAIRSQLLECARSCFELDSRMEEIYNESIVRRRP